MARLTKDAYVELKRGFADFKKNNPRGYELGYLSYHNQGVKNLKSLTDPLYLPKQFLISKEQGIKEVLKIGLLSFYKVSTAFIHYMDDRRHTIPLSARPQTLMFGEVLEFDSIEYDDNYQGTMAYRVKNINDIKPDWANNWHRSNKVLNHPYYALRCDARHYE